jgi:sugar-specific transcriptional regulator TrmB
MLDVLGLDEQVEKVYGVLLRGRPFSVRELMPATGLTASRVRRALRQLGSHGLVAPLAGTPPRHVAVDPSLALDRLLLEREEQLRQARVHSQEAGDRFRQAVAGRDPAKLVEFVTGREHIIQRYDQLQRSARRELRAFDRPPYQSGCDNDAEVGLLDQGVRVRVVFETAAADHAARFATAGGEAGAAEPAGQPPDR